MDTSDKLKPYIIEFEDGYQCRIITDRVSKGIKIANKKRSMSGRNEYARVYQVTTEAGGQQ